MEAEDLPLPPVLIEPSVETKPLQTKTADYFCLWQRYSQGTTVRSAIEQDIAVGRRARADGHSSKTVSLMLAAASPLVQAIIDRTGKPQARIYVNQTVKQIFQDPQQAISSIRSEVLGSERQAELD